MGFISRSFQRSADNGITLDDGAGWSKILGGGAAGVKVNETSALALPTVYACVRVLAETFASMPIFLYERKGKSKVKAVNHTVYKLLHDKPNEEMTPFTFKQVIQTNLQIRGNAYALIDFDEKWNPKALYPLLADRTYPQRNYQTGEIEYHTTLKENIHMVFPKWRIVHLKGFGFDGLKGYSPLELQRKTLAGGVALQKFGNDFFERGAKPSGILRTDNKLSDPAYKRLKDSMEEKYAGLSNSHKIMILEEGLTFNALSIPPDDAQFIESRKLNALDICKIYRVPPHMVGILDHATFSNIEHQSIQFATGTMLPLCTMSEQEFAKELLTEKECSRYTIEQNLDAIVRGDMKSRYEAYAIGRQNGFLSVNDIHEKENMNEVEGGDTYLTQLNAIPSELCGDYWKAKIKSGDFKGEGGVKGEPKA